jgi:hypothetical protein
MNNGKNRCNINVYNRLMITIYSSFRNIAAKIIIFAATANYLNVLYYVFDFVGVC